jgi:NCS1 family nucleobase:cation symporter-1
MGELLCFLAFWALNLVFIIRGMNSIKRLADWSAPFLLVIGVIMLAWAGGATDGWGPMLSQPSKFQSSAEFWPVFAAGLTAMVGYWATLSLNIPDFSRYARSQRDQIFGQAVGLPLTMTFYSFIGIAVTGATISVFGEAIWDPMQLMVKFNSPIVAVLALVTFAVATLSTNIAANVVSPANDFSNLAPGKVSFKTGGIITGIVGLLMCPWKLYQDPGGYIFTWLIGYSALLGPIGGIMIADYFVFRRRRLDVASLYDAGGEYRYAGGFSVVGISALVIAILPNLPGFLVTIKALDAASVPARLIGLYNYAWFAGFIIAFCVYLALRRVWPRG